MRARSDPIWDNYRDYILWSPTISTGHPRLFYFQQVRPVRSRCIEDGKIKAVNVHGAMECVNPDCLSFKCGYTVKPRDARAAVAIALAGVSLLTDPQRETLPPFAREMRPQDNALVATINTNSSLGSISSPPTHRSRSKQGSLSG